MAGRAEEYEATTALPIRNAASDRDAATTALPLRPAPPTRHAPAPTARSAAPVTDAVHRVRSAVSLLVVSVLVGTLLAGIVAVALFLAGIALRRAVG